MVINIIEMFVGLQGFFSSLFGVLVDWVKEWWHLLLFILGVTLFVLSQNIGKKKSENKEEDGEQEEEDEEDEEEPVQEQGVEEMPTAPGFEKSNWLVTFVRLTTVAIILAMIAFFAYLSPAYRDASDVFVKEQLHHKKFDQLEVKFSLTCSLIEEAKYRLARAEKKRDLAKIQEAQTDIVKIRQAYKEEVTKLRKEREDLIKEAEKVPYWALLLKYKVEEEPFLKWLRR